MAFTPYTPAEIAAAEPTKQELFQKLSDNFDDHEARITTNQAGSIQLTPIVFRVIGSHWKSGAETDIMFERITSGITLTAATLFVIDGGSSGTLTIDVQKSAAGGGAFTTLFTVKPTLASGAGDFATNLGTLIASPDLVDGDILRLDVDSWQINNDEWYVQLEFEAT